MKYRAEVDGLRAVAILPVIFFHAGFQLFEGGFVGVDVFFVVSGYLITTIILSDLNNKNFSIVTFYERRARRIMPALFFVMICCLPFAWAWLLPHHYKDFSESLIAVSFFSSNVLFWREAGYFGVASEFKPLLHTWSLAVEEQYYLLFPLFLMALWKLRKRWILGALTFVGVISLAAAQWGAYINPSATFFLLPTRAWELVVGALIAFYFLYCHEHAKGMEQCKNTRQVFSAVGLIMILYSVFAFDKSTPFPSFYALLPTIGTGFIIVFATPETTVGRLLSTKIMVGIGLISYSAYLWHQPLFVFARHRSLGNPSISLLLGLSAFSILLAFISWRYVESPFRNKKIVNRKGIFTFSIVGSVFFATIGLAGHRLVGYNNFFGKDKTDYLNYFENSKPDLKYFEKIKLFERYRNQCNFLDVNKWRNNNTTIVPVDKIADECHIRNPDKKYAVLIWGDSHAQQLYYGLNEFLPDNWQILQVATTGVYPKINAKKNKNDIREYSNWFAYETVKTTKPDVVVIAQNDKHNINDMSEIDKTLKDIGIKKVIFVGPSPHWVKSLPEIIAQFLWNRPPQKTYFGIDENIIKLDKAINNELQGDGSPEYISIIDTFCDEGGCKVYFGENLKTGISTWDYGHLTPVASLHFAKEALAKKITQ